MHVPKARLDLLQHADHTQLTEVTHMQGAHIDELFTAERDSRLKFNERLAERSSSITGHEPLQRFDMHKVAWREYYPAPTAQFYVRRC